MSISVCVFKHVQSHVCVQECMHVHLNMCRFMFRGQTLVSFLRQFIAHFCFFETGCLVLAWNSLKQTRLTARDLQESVFISFPSAGIRSVCRHPWLYNVSSGAQPQILCLQGKHVTSWADSVAQFSGL